MHTYGTTLSEFPFVSGIFQEFVGPFVACEQAFGKQPPQIFGLPVVFSWASISTEAREVTRILLPAFPLH